MRVVKFGGSSVANSKIIREVFRILHNGNEYKNCIIVLSALGGVTNKLMEVGRLASQADPSYKELLQEVENRHIQLCQELLPEDSLNLTLDKVNFLFRQLKDICKGIYWIQELSDKTLDYLMSFGESLSSTIVADYFLSEGRKVLLVDPTKFIKTDNTFGKARVNLELSYKLMKDHFQGHENWSICPGFIASNENNQISTLGRGGSDYTASLIAAALTADLLEIWTDVDGLMTADPRFVPSAHTIHSISYEDAMELSHFGAKVIYPPTIQPVLDKNIPIQIRNTFNSEHGGTLISNREEENNGNIVKGLSSIQHIALINLKGSGMVGIPNFSHRLFNSLSREKINIILITQASSEHSICVGIDESDVAASTRILEDEFEYELRIRKIDPLEIEQKLSIVALVGSRMKQQSGVSGRLFSTLGNNGINIKAIAQGSSERNISVVIDHYQIKKALNSLHESFFLSERKTINLFIVGVGNVGAAFLDQLRSQEDFLRESQHLNIRVAAIANSKKMVFNEEGINLENWHDQLMESNIPFSVQGFKEQLLHLNMRNSVFVDNTASEAIASNYLDLLSKTISVITPNKVACSSSYQHYIELKKTAVKRNSKFLFETNVGAGLPVISTLNDLIKSGDEIQRIEAVLSGSLNFIFNTYGAGMKFVDIVRLAMNEGYTEPDPRIDLSGIDVKRKILILIRESGIPIELDAIESEDFIPENCMNAASVDEFLDQLENNEGLFRALVEKAEKSGTKMKYVASFNGKTAQTGLQFIKKDHPFYNLEGKDNIVLFYTRRYTDQPLVIKGAGAGAEVTASGIFADVLRYANK